MNYNMNYIFSPHMYPTSTNQIWIKTIECCSLRAFNDIQLSATPILQFNSYISFLGMHQI